VVKRVGDHRCVIAFGETKTGMSVPGDFHIKVSLQREYYTARA
jgi:hypothetical protein